ncbi:hypothetical protein LINPERHAP1_LOCUS18244, partial [Linum perenne]
EGVFSLVNKAPNFRLLFYYFRVLFQVGNVSLFTISSPINKRLRPQL